MSTSESDNPIHAACLEDVEAAEAAMRTTELSVERESVFKQQSGQVIRQPSLAYMESLKKKKERSALKPRRDSVDHFSLKKKLEAMEMHGKFKKRYLCAALVAFGVAGLLFALAGIVSSTEKQAQALILYLLGSVMIIVGGYYTYQFLGRLYQWEGFEVQLDTSHEIETMASAGIRKNFATDVV